MTSDELWKVFREKTCVDEPYEAWAFGGDDEVCDRLAALVLEGKKTATASLYQLYLDEGEKVPEIGCYSVITDHKGEALCVVRDTDVTIVPFDEVSSIHAYLEGEGDRSLEYWREVHRQFFSPDFEKKGLEFDPKCLVVLEEFEVLYRAVKE